MTREEAKKILEAYIACESKKAHFECSENNCDDNCPLLYEMGTVGEFNEAINMGIKALEQTQWIPVSKRFPDEDGDYYVTYEKGYVEDYDLPPIGIVGFEVDCESFGYWQEHFSITMGSLGSDWEEIPVTAWMPLPKPYKGE